MAEASRADASRRGDVLALAASALLAMLLVLAVHRESPRTLVSAHGLLHAAVIERIAADPFTLPPENPFFAGERLPYYWTYHALAAVLIRATGIDPLHAMECLSLASIAVITLAAGLLCASLFGRAGLGALALFLLLAGANVQAPLVLALRTLRDGGLPIDDGSYLWGLLHPAAARMRLGDPFGMYGPLVSVFLNTTARPLALAGLLGTLALVPRALARPDVVRLAALVLGAAAFAALGSLVAISGIAALAAGLALAGWLRDRASLGRASRVVFALALGVVLAAPSYLHLFGVASRGAGLPLAAGVRDVLGRAVALLSAGWLVSALAVIGLLRAGNRTLALALGIASALLTGAALVLRLPNGNEDNFFHAALAVLALLAAGAALPRGDATPIGVGSHRVVARRAGWIALVFLPAFCAVLAPFLRRPPVPIGFEMGRLVRLPAGDDRARIYAFVRDETEPDAVIVVDPGPPIAAFAGNTAELPAFTGRALYTERAMHYLARPFADAPTRARAARALVQGEAIDEAAEAGLLRLARPIYVLPGEPLDAAREARLVARLGEPVRREGMLALWRWRPHPSQGASRP